MSFKLFVSKGEFYRCNAVTCKDYLDCEFSNITEGSLGDICKFAKVYKEQGEEQPEIITICSNLIAVSEYSKRREAKKDVCMVCKEEFPIEDLTESIQKGYKCRKCLNNELQEFRDNRTIEEARIVPEIDMTPIIKEIREEYECLLLRIVRTLAEVFANERKTNPNGNPE